MNVAAVQLFELLSRHLPAIIEVMIAIGAFKAAAKVYFKVAAKARKDAAATPSAIDDKIVNFVLPPLDEIAHLFNVGQVKEGREKLDELRRDAVLEARRVVGGFDSLKLRKTPRP